MSAYYTYYVIIYLEKFGSTNQYHKSNKIVNVGNFVERNYKKIEVI